MQSNNTMTRKEKWVFTLMVVPFYLMAASYFLTIYEFFHDYLQLEDTYFYIASIIYMVVNAVNDPLLAMWSDGIDPKKFGSRRLIFIRWGGLFWALTYAFTYIPWSLSNQVVMFIQYTVFMCMLDNGLSLVIMCWLALLPEMESDNRNRVKMGYFTGIVIFFASIVGSLIIFVKDLDDTWAYFRYLTWIIAAVVIIFTFIFTSLIKEREEFHYEKPYPFWKGLGKALKMRSLWVYMLWNLFFNVIPAGFGASFIYLYLLVIPGLNTTIYFVLTSIGTFFVPAIALRLQKKWGMKKTILIIGSISVFGTALIYLGTILSPSYILQDNPIPSIIALIGVLFSSWVAGIPKAFTSTITALSMDEFEVKYGVRRETTILGLNALITKPGDSVGTVVVTAVLTATNYIPDSSIQPISALNGIRTLMLLIPAAFMLIGLFIILFYPLFGKKLMELEAEIQRIHAEKQKNLASIQERQESGTPS